VIVNLDLALVESGGWRLDDDKLKTKKIRDSIIAIEKERIKNKEKKPVLLEKKYTAKLFSDLPEFVIVIDAYMDNGRVLDWKTGNISEIYEGERVQGKLYQMVLEANKIPVTEVVFHFLQNGMSATLPKISDGYVYERAKEMCDMIENDRFPKRQSGLCHWCPYILRCQFSSECPWCL
jgi:CRISPR/Cas system-associated exonuclease Cas4 (RecB family)